MVAPAIPKVYRKKRPPANIPEYLIYEIMDGKPIYYKGYRDVLNKTKQPEEIMGTSNLQWKIISYILSVLFDKLGIKNYHIATNEPGLHLDKRNNLSGDILVYNKGDIQPNEFGVKYADKPALIHFEVDVTADLSSDFEYNLYLQKKINKLIDFGTKKIIWIFSKSNQVLVVTNKEQWNWYDWEKPVEIFQGHSFNIGMYLDEEGIVV